MAPDPSARFHEMIEFRGSSYYAGFVTLLLSHDGGQNISQTEFSLIDLAVLQDKIDELLGVPACKPCREGRHADCPQHHGWQTTVLCTCDNRSAHAAITAAQVTAVRSRRQ
jgi:hypothetical protein